MASLEIKFRSSVEKELKVIPRQDQVRVLRRIRDVADDPRPPQSKKLTGQERYRLRQGNYRILYEIQDQQLLIVKVAHRRDVYRD